MKKQRISKKILYVILSVMVISICTLTLAYAVLSSTLTIGGSSEIVGSSWNITISEYNYWEEEFGISEETLENINIDGVSCFSNGFISGDAVLVKKPSIFDTSISDMQVSLTKPSDAVILYFSVKNNGTIPAKIESIVRNTPTISSSTNNAADLEFISNNWFGDFDFLESSDEDIDEGYILCPGQLVKFGFGTMIDENATAVSSSNISISNMGGTINFVQADKSLCLD